MADYHGDVMHRMGNIYSADDRNYFAAILFLLFFGGLGAHRFYLNDATIGWMYFLPFAGAVFASVATLNPMILFWEMLIASVFLLLELVWFIYRWAVQ